MIEVNGTFSIGELLLSYSVPHQGVDNGPRSLWDERWASLKLSNVDWAGHNVWNWNELMKLQHVIR
jgi:hypothetical protein